MGRSKWKGPFINTKHLANLDLLTNNAKIARNCEIIPKFVGKTFQIHNGKNYIEILVTEEMIGHKFGEFLSTRSKFFFKKSKNN